MKAYGFSRQEKVRNATGAVEKAGGEKK